MRAARKSVWTKQPTSCFRQPDLPNFQLANSSTALSSSQAGGEENESGETERTGRTGGEAIRDRSQASSGAGPPQRASGDREISGADNCSATPRFAVGSVAATL